MAWPKGRKLSEDHKAKVTGRKPSPPLSLHFAGVAEWLPFLEYSLKKAFPYRKPPRVAQETFRELATRLALFGPPTDQQACTVFDALARLLFSWRRLNWMNGDSLRKYVEVLPTTQVGLLQVVAAVIVVEGKFGPLEKLSFPVRNFIAWALQMPNARVVEMYLEACLSDPKIQVKELLVFSHPNWVPYIKDKYLRGLFPGYSADEGSHSQGSYQAPKIKTIRVGEAPDSKSQWCKKVRTITVQVEKRKPDTMGALPLQGNPE